MADVINVRARYLDASAAVKLVVDETESTAIRLYVAEGGPFYITSVCVSEVLTALKVKFLYRKELSQDEYFCSAYGFIAQLRGPIHVEDVTLQNSSTFSDVEQLATIYKIDLIDALQLYVLKHGRFSNFVGPSKSLLITADRALGIAARREGLDVWNCILEPAPRT